MKVTYIYPHLWAQEKSSDALQPLAVAALAAHTPAHWEIRFFDERVEPINLWEPTDLVVLTVMTFTAKRAYNISAHYRKRGIPVVMGGFHPTIMTEEVLQHADGVISGDLENIWPQVLRDVEQGELKPLYSSGIVQDPCSIRFDRSIFKDKKYAPMVPVQFSRGCRYACDFCSIHSFYGPRVVSRPMDRVLQEISQIPQKYLIFVDDNLFVNEKTILPFLKELKGLKKKWTCQISIDAAFNDQLLLNMKDAGCSAVLVGFESMDQDNLRDMAKGGNLRHKDYGQAVKRFRAAGLMVCGAFVFGYDHDKEDTLWRTLDFALKEKLALCHFNLLFPYPQTKVYERLKEQGRLFYDKWWLHEDYRYGDPLFDPAGIQGQKLSELCFQARKEFNRHRHIFSRGLDFKANARSPQQYFSFLLSNWITRREIHRKQGRPLG
ncbi:MAG: radical SAM protein [Spirochaetaceae bacterium]|jgi:radical SAM superfamily enzyme YgiQ (UPF0313 family)|nr:radical SAM protein [Spirochaetaceae bacterium]